MFSYEDQHLKETKAKQRETLMSQAEKFGDTMNWLKELLDPALFWPVLTQALKHSPELLLLQLGWQTAGVAPWTKRKCMKRLRHGYGLHLAERQALAHAYVCHVDAVPELWFQEIKGWRIHGCDVDNFLRFLGGNVKVWIR